MTAPLLALADFTVAYGSVEAVRAATLSIADNEIVTVIGANSAGKTTLLNAVMGVLPSRGAMRFAGADGESDLHQRIQSLDLLRRKIARGIERYAVTTRA